MLKSLTLLFSNSRTSVVRVGNVCVCVCDPVCLGYLYNVRNTKGIIYFLIYKDVFYFVHCQHTVLQSLPSDDVVVFYVSDHLMLASIPNSQNDCLVYYVSLCCS